MTFEEEYKKGCFSEKLAIDYFKRKGWKVYDLRNSSYWRKRDCDLKIEKDKKSFLFEVKQQKRIETHNEIIIELWQYNSNKDGWYYYSEADYFLFVNPIAKEGYIIGAFNLKNFIENSNLREEFNNYSNCDVLYIDLAMISGIWHKVDLRG